MNPDDVNIQAVKPMSEEASDLQAKWLAQVQRLQQLDQSERTIQEMFKRDRTEATAQAGRYEAQFQIRHAADIDGLEAETARQEEASRQAEQARSDSVSLVPAEDGHRADVELAEVVTN